MMKFSTNMKTITNPQLITSKAPCSVLILDDLHIHPVHSLADSHINHITDPPKRKLMEVGIDSRVIIQISAALPTFSGKIGHVLIAF